MFIQKRVYKYSEDLSGIQRHIEEMPKKYNLSGRWTDEHHLIVKKKGPFSVFRLHVDVSDVKEHWRLNVLITADARFFLLFLPPLLLGAYGLTHLSNKGMLIFLGSVSLFIFVLLINSANIFNLKRNFKHAMNIL